jgi:hypothetical protein
VPGLARALLRVSVTEQGSALPGQQGQQRVNEDKTMLSHIVNLVNDYEFHHGAKPNLVYMNETHYGYLREELPGVQDHYDLVSILGIDIALSEEIIQPSVATVRFGEENILVS